MLAWVAFTSEDLPMPRAPQSRALLAGSPSAKRSVFSIRMSRIRSMPLSRPRSTRLTRGTGASRPFGCQTNASALARVSASLWSGEVADRCAATDSSARAIRSAVADSADVALGFDAAAGDLREPALGDAREPVFRGF